MLLGTCLLRIYTVYVKIDAENIVHRVEETLAAEGGARIIHDMLDQLAGEMEKLAREEHKLLGELLGVLSRCLDCDVPEGVLMADGPPGLRDRLKQVGLNDSAAGQLPDEAMEIWDRLAPQIFTLRKKSVATDTLINDIVERLYRIPRIPE